MAGPRAGWGATAEARASAAKPGHQFVGGDGGLDGERRPAERLGDFPAAVVCSAKAVSSAKAISAAASAPSPAPASFQVSAHASSAAAAAAGASASAAGWAGGVGIGAGGSGSATVVSGCALAGASGEARQGLGELVGGLHPDLLLGAEGVKQVLDAAVAIGGIGCQHAGEDRLE